MNSTIARRDTVGFATTPTFDCRKPGVATQLVSTK